MMSWIPAILAVFFIVVGCDTLKTRDQTGDRAGSTRTTPGGETETQLPETSQQAETTPPPVYPTPPPAPTPLPVPPPPTFLTKEPPKVGLILGPGGMRAFAHIGVLKEIARARMPVKGVIGLEWGALIGGLYALGGQANEVEWKAFKLREDDIPGSGLLSKRITAEKSLELGTFLGTAFAGQTLEKSRIEFACPAYNIRTEKFGWYSRGTYKDALIRCMAYPPYFTAADGWLAAPFAIEEAAQFLRSKGANLIVYVNVLAGGEIFPTEMTTEQYADFVLWSEVRRQASRQRLPGVNVVINVNTGTDGYMDYANRRQMMDAGSRSAQDAVTKLATQYGF